MATPAVARCTEEHLDAANVVAGPREPRRTHTAQGDRRSPVAAAYEPHGVFPCSLHDWRIVRSNALALLFRIPAALRS